MSNCTLIQEPGGLSAPQEGDHKDLPAIREFFVGFVGAGEIGSAFWRRSVATPGRHAVE
jgi:hypothetical protein